MRKFVLFLAAALLGGPAIAADHGEKEIPKVSGVLSLWGGFDLLDTGDSSFDSNGAVNLGGNARLLIHLRDHFGLQLEAGGRFGPGYDSNSSNDTLMQGAVGAHAIYHMPGSHAFGVFTALYGGPNLSEPEHSTYFGGGVEAAAFWNMHLVFAQIGAGTIINSNPQGAGDHVFGRAGARFKLTDPLTLSLEALVGVYDGGGFEGGGHYANWTLELARAIEGTPVSLFVAYNGHYVHQDELGDPTTDATEHIFKLGGRFAINGGNETIIFDLPDHSVLTFADDL